MALAMVAYQQRAAAMTGGERTRAGPPRMAGARELLARGQMAPAAMVLAAVKEPEKARGWRQIATDILARGIPRSTLRHNWNAMSAAWSPDGKRIVTASADKTARIWNADGTGAAAVLTGHDDKVWSAAWSPDGKRIVTASADQTARVWNADGTGDPIVLKDHEDMVLSAAWSPDGKRIVTAYRQDRADLERRRHGRPRRPPGPRGRGPVRRVEPRRQAHLHRVVVYRAGLERRWHGRPHRPQRRRDPGAVPHMEPRRQAHLHRVHGDTARVWNADGTGDPVVLNGRVDSAAWSPDGKRIVTASADQTVWIWNAEGVGDPVVLNGHARSLSNSAAWSPDGKRIVTTSERQHRAGLERRRHAATTPPVVLKGHEGERQVRRVEPRRQADPRRVLGRYRAGLERRRPGAIPSSSRATRATGMRSSAWSPDGERIVTASWDKTARVWSADGQGDPIILDGHEDLVQSAAWSPDGERIVTASWDKTARVWSADEAGNVMVLQGHEDGGRLSVAWSPDGKRIVTASADNTARVWNANGVREALIVLRGHENSMLVPWSAAWSPDGKRHRHRVRGPAERAGLERGQDGRPGHRPQEPPTVRESPDRRVEPRPWQAHRHHVSGQDRAGLERRWRSPAPHRPQGPRRATVRSAAWSPDGKRIVTASEDKTARVWDADGTAAIPIVLKGHQDDR